MHLSLSGCGFLGIYHIGVIKGLLNHGPLFLSRLDNVAGTSAGALVGTILVCDPQKVDVSRHRVEISIEISVKAEEERLLP